MVRRRLFEAVETSDDRKIHDDDGSDELILRKTEEEKEKEKHDEETKEDLSRLVNFVETGINEPDGVDVPKKVEFPKVKKDEETVSWTEELTEEYSTSTNANYMAIADELKARGYRPEEVNGIFDAIFREKAPLPEEVDLDERLPKEVINTPEFPYYTGDITNKKLDPKHSIKSPYYSYSPKSTKAGGNYDWIPGDNIDVENSFAKEVSFDEAKKFLKSHPDEAGHVLILYQGHLIPVYKVKEDGYPVLPKNSDNAGVFSPPLKNVPKYDRKGNETGDTVSARAEKFKVYDLMRAADAIYIPDEENGGFVQKDPELKAEREKNPESDYYNVKGGAEESDYQGQYLDFYDNKANRVNPNVYKHNGTDTWFRGSNPIVGIGGSGVGEYRPTGWDKSDWLYNYDNIFGDNVLNYREKTRPVSGSMPKPKPIGNATQDSIDQAYKDAKAYSRYQPSQIDLTKPSTDYYYVKPSLDTKQYKADNAKKKVDNLKASGGAVSSEINKKLGNLTPEVTDYINQLNGLEADLENASAEDQAEINKRQQTYKDKVAARDQTQWEIDDLLGRHRNKKSGGTN